MKKIMFSDRYGLTKAVIDGRKTMTRRIVHKRVELKRAFAVIFDEPHGSKQEEYIKSARYSIGEIVAVAQSYKDAGVNPDSIVSYKEDGTPVTAIQSPGWTNKMFTRADLMPHQIRITGIRIERLQDISDEDCLREGVRYIEYIDSYYFERTDREEWFYFNAAREAFAALIDKVSGRGTWESNPYVVVYGFELVK